MKTGTHALQEQHVVTELEARYNAVYMLQYETALRYADVLHKHVTELSPAALLILALKHSAKTFIDSATFEDDVLEISSHKMTFFDLLAGPESDAESASGTESTSDTESDVSPDEAQQLYQDCLSTSANFAEWQPDNPIQEIMKSAALKAEAACP